MSLKIIRIKNHGDAKEEYIILQAINTVNINNFMIADRTFNKAGNLSNIHRHFYRFPSATIQKGHYVALYTGEGTNSSNGKYSDVPCTLFYWGSKAAFWNDTDVEQAELLKVESIEKKNAR